MSPQEISFWFSAEVKPHESELRGYLYHRLGELSEVEDIVQESFKRIIEMREREAIEAPKRLLFTIAKNLLMDFFRKRSVAKTSFVGEIESYFVLPEEECPFDAACRNEELEALRQAIETLPPKCRTILLLRRIENLSYKAIARKLNISESTVETQLSRGLKRCHKELKKRGLIARSPLS